jgi:phenylpropionate dioxygenase-like ring-hydroxylating dioxygenase large terminal subunit
MISKHHDYSYHKYHHHLFYHYHHSYHNIIIIIINIIIGKVFVLWRDNNGKPVCQDAFCIHLGANLAKGGKVVDNCIECPFHRWKFNSDGTVHSIPYLKKPTECQTSKKLKTYHCVDWCGLVCVYFHADYYDDNNNNKDHEKDKKEPEFSLPSFVEKELHDHHWVPHLTWDIGFVTLSPVDWVDQAGDHAHFHSIHADFLFPWTKISPPKWLLKIFPLGK